MSERRRLNLVWGNNIRDGKTHVEWSTPCGCAYHPEPQPHVHHCAEHKSAQNERETFFAGWVAGKSAQWIYKGQAEHAYEKFVEAQQEPQ